MAAPIYILNSRVGVLVTPHHLGMLSVFVMLGVLVATKWYYWIVVLISVFSAYDVWHLLCVCVFISYSHIFEIPVNDLLPI